MSKRLMHNGLWSNLLVLLLLALGAGGVQAKERVTYFHNDLLGSPVAATDSQGALLWQEEYTPYGKRLSKEDDGKNSRWYTGKSEVAGLGVQYFDARWYDAELGRFLSIDPVDIDAGNIRSFNRYAYANNNPYRYVDPNGESPLDIGFLVVDVVKLGVAVYSGVGVAAAAADVGMSVVGVLSPVPGTGLALKGLRTAKMAKAVDKAGAAKGAGKVSGKGPDFVVSPGGTAFPVPKGATGPTPVVNPGGKTTGSAFAGGQGGANGKVDTMRIMDPTSARGKSPGYPNGYIKYENKSGQGVDPYSGRTLPNKDSHFPID